MKAAARRKRSRLIQNLIEAAKDWKGAGPDNRIQLEKLLFDWVAELEKDEREKGPTEWNKTLKSGNRSEPGDRVEVFQLTKGRGHRDYWRDACFLTEDAAKDFIKKTESYDYVEHIVSADGIVGSDGEVYEVKSKVYKSYETKLREEALSRLSDEEKRVLGLLSKDVDEE